MAKQKEDKKKGRPDGLKTVTFTFEGKRYYCYGHTLREAKQKAEDRKKELEAGKYRRSSELTFSEYFDRWSEAREGTVKPVTLRKQDFQYEAAAAVAIDQNGKRFGDLLLSEIEVQHVRTLQKALLTRTDQAGKAAKGKKERTPQTVNDIIALVSHILHDAVNERAITWNPCNGVKNLKRVEKPARETFHRALTEAELTAFFSAAAESWYINLYRFLLATGCRCGEAGALTLEDIKADHLEIRRTITKNRSGVYVIGDSPKTSYGRRTIPITPEIRAAILEQRKVNAAVFGNVTGISETVFKTSWGNLLAVANVDRDIARICKKAGIQKFTAHAFRDSFATRAIERGMNPKTLQDILGHSDFSLTMSLYAHSMEDTKQKEMNMISLALPG